MLKCRFGSSCELKLYDNHFARLGDDFSSRVDPTPVPAPAFASFNVALAEALQLDGAYWQSPQGLAELAGNQVPAAAEPRAMLYAGHQFGGWVSQLGDGRAISLGQLATPVGSWDLQLKGAGPTPYSRGGDGRAVLRSSIREYLMSEAMHGLGIATTRALSLVVSPLQVQRETVETAAIVSRMAPSHVRFGSFEVFYSRGQHQLLKQLADYVMQQYYVDLDTGDYVAWLAEIGQRTAMLCAQWQAVGFAHGVLNTDNMSILGLTLDYGPFGMQDYFDPDWICNHSDHQGRYAFASQPAVMHWNYSRLLQACLPLLPGEPAQAISVAQTLVDDFPGWLESAYLSQMRGKLALDGEEADDQTLVTDFLAVLAQAKADYSGAFRALADYDQLLEVCLRQLDSSCQVSTHDATQAALVGWWRRYQARLGGAVSSLPHAEQIEQANPLYVPRNHLLQQAIAAAEQGDYTEIDRQLLLYQQPYTPQVGAEAYTQPAPAWAAGLQLSCSS